MSTARTNYQKIQGKNISRKELNNKREEIVIVDDKDIRNLICSIFFT